MNESLTRLIAVALGGGAGAVARYGAGLMLAKLHDGRFGYATLLVNAVGCLVIGLLMHEAWSPAERPAGAWHTGVTVGLLGGLTTFSTFGYQTVRHLEAGEPVLALANVALNVLLGIAAAAAGLAIGRLVWPV